MAVAAKADQKLVDQRVHGPAPLPSAALRQRVEVPAEQLAQHLGRGVGHLGFDLVDLEQPDEAQGRLPEGEGQGGSAVFGAHHFVLSFVGLVPPNRQSLSASVRGHRR